MCGAYIEENLSELWGFPKHDDGVRPHTEFGRRNSKRLQLRELTLWKGKYRLQDGFEGGLDV
jgi:hypothetical protein